MAVKFNNKGYSIEVETGADPVEEWMLAQDELFDLLSSTETVQSNNGNFYYAIRVLRSMMPDLETAKKMMK